MTEPQKLTPCCETCDSKSEDRECPQVVRCRDSKAYPFQWYCVDLQKLRIVKLEADVKVLRDALDEIKDIAEKTPTGGSILTIENKAAQALSKTSSEEGR